MALDSIIIPAVTVLGRTGYELHKRCLTMWRYTALGLFFFVPQEKIKTTLTAWRGFYQSTADSICQDGHIHVRKPLI